MLWLVRLVLDDDWSPARAARQLRESVADDAILNGLRARVIWAQSDRVSTVAERAIATLDLALTLRDGEQPEEPARLHRRKELTDWAGRESAD